VSPAGCGLVVLTVTGVIVSPACARAAAAPPRAPTGPPLVSGAAGAAPEEGTAAPSGSTDPLVENGLGSPVCRDYAARGGLSPAAAADCRTSGFVAAAAPTEDYALDVHIDTGAFGIGENTFQVAAQDYLIGPVWMGLVWVVHALVVALEWCYSIDLLDSPAMAGVARGLREAQAAFTQPWLAIVLAVAAVLAAYHGLVRRRVAETVGEAALMLAMMAVGLWVIVNPTGTVGALGRWAEQASIGTLGAVAGGSPQDAPRTLADSMREVFAAAIGAPWCYMEFGDVQWCRDPALLDPRLRAAGLRIAAEAGTPARSAELLRAARTNGELFLALPANQAGRNSINDTGSLLRVLCESSDATECHGATAAQAEFRTAGETSARGEGLLLVVAGALGMVLLLGFIALRLLEAAITSLFYLLMAPAAVLAPALGDGGRAAFRGWATRLLAAVTSKLLYSFLLGVVLLMARILGDLGALGWWTQWLLISVLWWGAFRHRHQALSFAGASGRGQTDVRGLRLASRLMGVRETGGAASWVRRKLSTPAPSQERRRMLTAAGRQRARAKADEQVGRTLESEHAAATVRADAAPEIQAGLSAKRRQLERIRSQRARASAAGDTRRVAKLDQRARRVEGEIEQGQGELTAARTLARDGERSRRRTGSVYTREQHEQRARFLDAQAQARPQDRDHARAAGVVGMTPEQYRALDGRGRREARLQIDRELAMRSQLDGAAREVAAAGEGSLGRRERRRAGRRFDEALEQQLRAGGHEPPSSLRRPSAIEQWREDGRARARTHAREPASGRSTVMDDAREVESGRKRQLGHESARRSE